MLIKNEELKINNLQLSCLNIFLPFFRVISLVEFDRKIMIQYRLTLFSGQDNTETRWFRQAQPPRNAPTKNRSSITIATALRLFIPA